MGKICDFAVYLGNSTTEARGSLTGSHVIGSRSIRVDSSALERYLKACREGSNFYGGSPYNYACTVWPGSAKFGVVTRVGRGVFQGVSRAPSIQQGAPWSWKVMVQRLW